MILQSGLVWTAIWFDLEIQDQTVYGLQKMGLDYMWSGFFFETEP
jgi:hypothetical protein